jgi:hypothetical protein
VLVLPDRLHMNATLREKLADYLRRGGRVLSSGTAGLDETQSGFALPEWDFDFDGVDPSNASYYRIVDNDDPKVSDIDYCMYGESNSGVLFRGGRMLAQYVKPYFNHHWDGFHGYFYTPPEKPTEYAAAAVNAAGNVCHIAFAIFRSYYERVPYAQKALVRKCLERLLPDPLIKTSGVPSTARVTATGCDAYTLLHTKVTYPEIRGKMGIIEEHAVLEAGATVHIRGHYASACTLPENESVEVTYAPGGYTVIRLPRIVGYRMILLEK